MLNNYCICCSWLTTYYITNLDSDKAMEYPSNFIRRCHAIIDSREMPRYDPHIVSQRTIQCFTMVDAFRIVEWEIYELQRPIHRVLELIDGEWREIISCTNKPDPEKVAKLRSLYEQQMAKMKARANVN